MNNDFTKYVVEKRAEGMSDSQIARSLGMSLKHFVAACNENDKTDTKSENSKPVAPPKNETKPIEKPKTATPENKKADTIKEITPTTSDDTPADDYNWMD